MPGRPIRLGFLYPLGGAEFEYYLYADRSNGAVRNYLVGTRVFGEGRDHDIQYLQQTAAVENLRAAALGLTPLACDAVMWACTSASFVDGRAHAEKQARAIAETVGCPASSTSLAFAAALQNVAAKRVAIVASYPKPAAEAFVRFLSEYGVEAPQLAWLDAPAGPDAARLGPQVLLTTAKTLDLRNVDAVLVPDTAIPGIDLARTMTDSLGRPCLTANQVTLWEALRLAGHARPLESLDITEPSIARV